MLALQKKNKFGEFCKDCSQPYYLNGVWIAGDYNNKIISKLIKNIKYHFAKDISEVISKFLNIFLGSLISRYNIIHPEELEIKTLEKFNNSIIIPVPLHKKRKKWRGFNQSEIIAKKLVKNFQLKNNLDTKNLIRIKHKKAQVKLSKKEREKNIKDCFFWIGKNLKNKNIILIDDVTTTGSTLNECAKVLKNNGAKEVWGLVIANG